MGKPDRAGAGEESRSCCPHSITASPGSWLERQPCEGRGVEGRVWVGGGVGVGQVRDAE